MEKNQTELFDILLQCLKKDKPRPDENLIASLSSTDWEHLLALAATQRVTPLLWHRLRQKGLEKHLPETATSQMREASRRNIMNNMRLNGELSRLLAALEMERIPIILLKGIVLSNAVYENISLREMNDIDLLAHPEHLLRIADILVSLGYKPVSPISIEGIDQVDHHLPRLIKKGSAHFEVHWNITDPGNGYSIKPEGLWERAVPVQIANHDTFMLSPEDMLLHTCMHTSYQHPFIFGLRPFCDISETIEHFGQNLNWQTVADRAIYQKWQRGVYLTLCLADELSGAIVPKNILQKLKPDDMSDVIIETAKTQILTEKNFATSIPTPFAQLLESRRWTDKIKIFIQRVFLPKAVISSIYPVPLNSPKIYGYYLVRLYDVLRRHQNTLKKYHKNDTTLKTLVERTKIIDDWMK